MDTVGKLVRCKTKFKYQQKPGINNKYPRAWSVPCQDIFP